MFLMTVLLYLNHKSFLFTLVVSIVSFFLSEHSQINVYTASSLHHSTSINSQLTTELPTTNKFALNRGNEMQRQDAVSMYYLWIWGHI